MTGTAVPGDSPTPDELRTWFAAQRTLLAWIRTSIAMTGFGFLVAKFGLFLRELALLGDAAIPASAGWSLWLGSALVLLGVAVNIVAALQHRNFLRRLPNLASRIGQHSWLEFSLSGLLSLLGIAMLVYLVSVAR